MQFHDELRTTEEACRSGNIISAHRTKPFYYKK